MKNAQQTAFATDAIEKTESAAKSASTPSAEEYLQYVQSKQLPSDSAAFQKIIYQSQDPAIRQIIEVIDQVASAQVPVFISGESGTGKEVIARSIHMRSNRAQKPFVAINCAALPSQLLESELFGYERGAFTGAMQRHAGKFEQAHGGTLLLDEITEMDLSLQAKLLRTLQEREVERLGGSGPVAVDVRIIATTNRDILKCVADGSFRQDLYYRLYVVHLNLPTLRQRAKDIVPLAQHFLKAQSEALHKPLALSEGAARRLQQHNWPGNIRELQNIMQRAALVCKTQVISEQDLQLPIAQSQRTAEIHEWIKALPIGRKLYDVEMQFILETLKHHSGNRTHAAKMLGISLRTLRNKINEFTALGVSVIQPQTGRSL